LTEDLFETVIPRRIDDVNLLIENIENDDIKISPYMENLIKKGIEEDNVIKDDKVKKRFHRTVYDFNQNKNKNKITITK
jgi:DNA-binding protein H-NS